MNTIDTYHRNLHNRLKELLNATQERQQDPIVRQASGAGQSFTPASTAEEIAFQTIRDAARARALKEAIELTNETYRSLFEKEQ